MAQKNKFLTLSLPALLVAVLFFASLAAWNYWQLRKQFLQKKAAWAVLEKQVAAAANNFHQEAGIVIKDLSMGWEIKVNEDKLFPSASMVKVPVMAAYMLASSLGKIDLKRNLTLRNRDRALGSGILKDYAPGTQFSIEDLIEIMIVHSDNTAANMLIGYMGFEPLNAYFRKLGLENTNLSRKMMDFKSRKAGVENYTSARDTAFLLEEIYRNRLVNKAYSQRCLAILSRQKIRDRIPARLPADTPVAHKTGLERGICHDAGIIFTSRGDLLICALTKHNYKTARPAKKFISNLALYVYNYYAAGASSRR
ncbi:MAG: serine hydrolase [Candidatus Omnitrophota bacterium]